MGKQQGELGVGVVKIEVHGGGEAAQQRGGDGLGGGFGLQGKGLLGLGEHQHGFGLAGWKLVTPIFRLPKCDLLAVFVQQGDFDGYHHRLFGGGGHIGGIRQGLLDVQNVVAVGFQAA